MTIITIDELKKAEIRIGQIIAAEKVEKADKLLKLSVDFGPRPAPVPPSAPVSPEGSAAAPSPEIAPPPAAASPAPGREIRQIISGIALQFPDPAALIGVRCAFVANLEPRTIRGLESQGMILAAKGEGNALSLLTVSADIPPGAAVS